MLNPHEHDHAPSRYEDDHASDCACDRCLELVACEDDTPSQAELERMRTYFIQRERIA